MLFIWTAFLNSRLKAYSISIALPYINVELETVKFSILARLLAVEILRIAEVSVIEPVFTLFITLKSLTLMLFAAPIV